MHGAQEDTNMTATYIVKYTDGSPHTEHDTYEEAVLAVEAEYPDAEIGHDGDLSEGGDRTLCWPDEESSIDDDGARACAVIIAEGI
jgi:hypothetical protein